MGDRGSVFAASKSSIGIRFRYRRTLCEERIKLPPTPRNLSYARNLRGKILAEIARGTFDYYAFFPESTRAISLAKEPAAMVTVGKKLDDWIAGMGKTLQKSTLIGYQRAIDYTLKPALGTKLLRDLTRDEIRKWIAGQDVSAKRLNNLLTPLRRMLAEAVADGVIPADPMRDISIKQLEPKDDDIDPFTPDEIKKILDTCGGQVRNLFQFAFWSGLRTSELIALRWQDVDFARGLIAVRQARVAGVLKAPKTKAGRRDIKMLPAARAALQTQREHTLLAGAFVFHDPRTGKPWAGDKPIREWHWRPALTAAKVRYRYPYQTRHTYASTLLSAGEHVMWVAQQMGHKDWMMVARVYGKWIPDVAPDAGEKAAAICGNFVGQSS
jgi:integrase